MTYKYVKYFLKNQNKRFLNRLIKIYKDEYYRLFSFSHGHGIGLYFLYLCWVAQLIEVIITRDMMRKIDTNLELRLFINVI